MQHLYFISLYLFLLAIVFFRLPNLYLLPDANSGLFTSQGVSRLIIIGIFFGSFFLSQNKQLFVKRKEKIIVYSLLVFFVCSSLSLIWAANIESFWNRYKDVVVGIMAFFVFYFFKEEKKKIIAALLISIPISIIYQAILLYGNSLYIFLDSIIYQRHFDLVQYNLFRSRIYIEVYDEAFIPLLVLLLDKKKKLISFFILLTLSLLSALAFLSNFRTRILMLILGVFSSFVFLKKFSLLRMVVILLVFLFIAIQIGFVAGTVWKTTFYDRFLLTHVRSDINTIFSREYQFKTALKMGTLSPFGVGLGNYYENLTFGKNNVIINIPGAGWYQSSANQYIHNNLAIVIAESGYITFSVYLFLLILFFTQDISLLKGDDRYKKSFVISFWLLFFFGLLNPPIPGTYQVLFWGIRGLLL